MNKTGTTATALSVAFIFSAVMVLDPKEAVDHPHTHQEAPSVPTLDSQPAIISTFTGTEATISPGSDVYISPRIPI
jgi:hypothetical protein